MLKRVMQSVGNFSFEEYFILLVNLLEGVGYR